MMYLSLRCVVGFHSRATKQTMSLEGSVSDSGYVPGGFWQHASVNSIHNGLNLFCLFLGSPHPWSWPRGNDV